MSDTLYTLTPEDMQSRENFIRDLQKAVPEAGQQLEDYHDFTERTLEECAGMENSIDDLNAEISDLEAQNSSLEDDLEAAREEIDELKEKLAEYE